ncbi:hypothetical protein FA13DRAFT_1879227 [Coprinellus micaceus]|uniref:Uncharacterized protein n=1 Tax=Coprinellus micaceus TaxID=71717 RepID=A0A4Y7T264_COPMI|nr:hypothetical protein FA13DRAFT_1879227 [Coprinellus micaceus]
MSDISTNLPESTESVELAAVIWESLRRLEGKSDVSHRSEPWKVNRQVGSEGKGTMMVRTGNAGADVWHHGWNQARHSPRCSAGVNAPRNLTCSLPSSCTCAVPPSFVPPVKSNGHLCTSQRDRRRIVPSMEPGWGPTVSVSKCGPLRLKKRDHSVFYPLVWYHGHWVVASAGISIYEVTLAGSD